MPPTSPSTPVQPTALLVVSATEAYVAGTTERRPVGPNGEWYVAHLLHTANGGQHWQTLSWQRTLFSLVRHPGFPNWPPEFVLGIQLAEESGVSIAHRDEWVPYEPGGESLWCSTFDGRRWRVRRLRFMDYEGGESARPVWPITLEDLPASIQPPGPPGDWGTGCNFAVNLE